MITLAALLLCGALQDARVPVPDDARQRDAEKMIRDVFKDEYKHTVNADKLAFAGVLLDQGVQTTEDAAARFVLMRDARDLASQAGDLTLAFRAIDEMAKSFDVAALPMKNAALTAASRGAKAPEDCARFAAAHLKLADEGVAADDYDAAAQTAGAAVTLAKRAKDAGLTARAESKQKELNDLRVRFEKVKRAREVLAKTPDDAAAGAVVGHFLCAVKGEWTEGLPWLAKGGDAALKSAAEKDLANPSDAPGCQAAGDAWWDAAVRESGIAKEKLRERALGWYAKAVDRLSGAARSKIEKRLTELRTERLGPSWIDVTAAFEKGNIVDLTAPEDGALSLQLKTLPAGTFDGVSAIVRSGPNRHVKGGILLDSQDFLFNVQPGNKCVLASEWGGKTWTKLGVADLPERDEYLLTVEIDAGHFVVSVDGEEKLRVKGRSSTIVTFWLQSDDGQVHYEKIKLRRKD